MQVLTAVFNEPIHHVCLMYGLRQTFEKMPFLNMKVLNIRGRDITMDNIVAPPPMMRDPEKRQGEKRSRNLVEVSYWKNRLSVEYNEGMCSSDVISTFIKTLIQDYLHFRHPFMKTCSENGYVLWSSSRYRIVEIQI